MTRGSEVFRPVVRRAVTVLATLSAAATLVAIVWGAKLAAPVPTESDTFSTGPLGHRAMYDSLRELGIHVLRGRRSDVITNDAPALFLEPETVAYVDGDRLELDEVIGQRHDLGYGTLVVLPKWTMQEGEDGDEEAVAASEAASEVLLAATGQQAASVGHLGSTEAVERRATGTLGSFAVSLPWLQTIDVPGAEVLLAVEGQAIAVWHDSGTIILSDPDILHSWNHHRADHAGIVLALVRDFGSDAVVVDEVFHGHGQQRSLAAALGQFPAYFILAQGLLLAVLVVIRGGRRFGPPEPEPGLGKGPAESIAVSASVLARGRSTGLLLMSYLEAVIRDIADQLQLGDGEVSQLAAQIDAIAKRRGEPPRAVALIGRVNALAGAERPPEAEVLAVARDGHDLHRLLTQRELAVGARGPRPVALQARNDPPTDVTTNSEPRETPS